MRKGFFSILMILVLLLFGNGCDKTLEMLGFENDVPDSVYDEDEMGLPAPVITDVNPKGKVYAGVTEVTITGENFDPDSGKCFVYFGGEAGEILSQTETQIVAIPPLVSGDTLEVKVSKLGAYAFGVYKPYTIKLAAIEYGGADANLDVGGMACDLNENLYFVANGEKTIYKVDPNSQEKEIYLAIDDFCYSMKMGPDIVLYFAIKKYLYTSPAGGGSYEKFNDTKTKNALSDFDFGENLNIYAAGKGVIYMFTSDGSYTEQASYDDYLITSLRVFDGFVYVAAYYTGYDTTVVQKGIWRNQINASDGALGAAELVFDWGQYVGPYGANILALTFNSVGDIYFSTEISSTGDALYVLRSNGTGDYSAVVPEPLYYRVLKPQYNNLCWGNGMYLYANYKGSDAADQRIIRITIEEDTAPYYGRK